MKRASSLAVALFLSACGGGGEATAAGEAPNAEPAESTASTPVYDLHEWGVVAVRQGSFEVAAGAGRAAIQVNVDKPVLYVHSEESVPFPLTVTVHLPESLRAVEHFPPTDLTPLRWRAEVGTARCHGMYPGATQDVVDARCIDGYCEVYELARYETDDARCLTVGNAHSPLLFYRLWAPGVAPTLPLGLALEGDEVVITRNTPGGTRGSVIRLRRVGTNVTSSVTALGDRVNTLRIGVPTAPASVGYDALRAALREQGLTPDESAAFLRGWRAALFGASVPASESADRPVMRDVDRLMPTDDESDGDGLAAPRDADVVLYWLTPEAIMPLARIEASPPPRHLRRVFMVRHVLN